jgi:hypothetical protein
VFQYHLYSKFWNVRGLCTRKPTATHFILFYFVELSSLISSFAAVAWDADGNIPSIPCVPLVV